MALRSGVCAQPVPAGLLFHVYANASISLASLASTTARPRLVQVALGWGINGNSRSCSAVSSSKRARASVTSSAATCPCNSSDVRLPARMSLRLGDGAGAFGRDNSLCCGGILKTWGVVLRACANFLSVDGLPTRCPSSILLMVSSDTPLFSASSCRVKTASSRSSLSRFISTPFNRRPYKGRLTAVRRQINAVAQNKHLSFHYKTLYKH